MPPLSPTPQAEELFDSLDRRFRPEDIAQLVLEELQPRLDRTERGILERAARGAIGRGGLGFSSMKDDFARPAGMSRQLGVAAELFPAVAPLPAKQHADPVALRDYLIAAERDIAKAFGASDFKKDRLNRKARHEAGLDLSKRQYNKRFRLAARMEGKRDRIDREWQKRLFVLVGKSRLASRLGWAEFAADSDSACFVSYYTARCHLRSEFTISGQQRPYDEIADMLFQRCRRSETANWWAIAQSFPDAEVTRRLTDEQKGRLLGEWFGLLEQVAELLREVWDRGGINRVTMVVRQGNDSSTWNNTASAWNKARESWISLLYAMEMDDLIEAQCPGKVMRLIAGDVAAWHRAADHAPDPDLAVWSELPLPWDVLSGAADCPRRLVEEACGRRSVDPIKSGWAAPRPGRAVAAFRPTPELVHGVTVGHPGLALWLRRAGFFSGKAVRLPEG
jgi:hypothetical protein